MRDSILQFCGEAIAYNWAMSRSLLATFCVVPLLALGCGGTITASFVPRSFQRFQRPAPRSAGVPTTQTRQTAAPARAPREVLGALADLRRGATFAHAEESQENVWKVRTALLEGGLHPESAPQVAHAVASGAVRRIPRTYRRSRDRIHLPLGPVACQAGGFDRDWA